MKISNLFLIFFFFVGCNHHKIKELPKKKKNKYELVEIDGIYFEKFDSTITYKGRFNENNLIFTEGTELTYSYQYISKNGEKYLFTEYGKGLRENGLWKLVKLSKADSNSYTCIKISVTSGIGPNSAQTKIVYDVLQKNGKKTFYHSSTGIVENEKNIWIHPPRMMNFKILELNPFPFIKTPFEIGNKWSWTLGIGSHYGNENWKTWSGEIRNNSTYEIIGKAKLNTKLGNLDCYIIYSEAQSELGQTSLKAYFNEIYGFVKLDFENIDNSKIIMLLEDYKLEQITPYNL